MRLTYTRFAAAVAVVSAVASARPPLEQFFTGDKIAYDKYKPRYHFTSEKNWINDPCAPYYDPKTDLYHLFYQYAPYTNYWHHTISWGHAVSKDMVRWIDMPVAMEPSPDGEDRKGVFDGAVVLSGYEGHLTAIYTGAADAVNYKFDYIPGSEKVLMATSEDEGRTWKKHPTPLIGGPPPQYSVLGWRDPFLFMDAEVDQKFGIPKAAPPKQYMLISSSEAGGGGRLFLYETDNLVDWKFKGPFFAPEAELPTTAADHSGKEWVGSFGVNFEVSNYFTLDDEDGITHKFINVGTEGGRGDTRTNHWDIWVSGDLVKTANGQVVFKHSTRGVADAGPAYGAYSFWDPKTKRRIMHSWLNEDLNTTRSEWAGALTLPRDHFVATYKNVVDPTNRLAVLGPFKVSDGPKLGGHDTKVVKTRGVRPIREVESLRGDVYTHHPKKSDDKNPVVETLPVEGKFYEIVATAKNGIDNGRVGFVIRHNVDFSEATYVYFDHNRGRVVIDRSDSTKDPSVVNIEDSAKFELFLFAMESNADVLERETLDLRLFVDNSIIEVFANDRFVLSSRIYPTDDEAVRISTYSTMGASFDEVKVYNNFESAFPERATLKQLANEASQGDVARKSEESYATSIVGSRCNGLLFALVAITGICILAL